MPGSVSNKPLAVMCGAIGKLPYGGMSLSFLQYLDGLREVGYDVHYVERINRANECYNPTDSSMSNDPTYAITYLELVLPKFGIERERFSFIDFDNQCHGSGWGGLREALDRADFVLAVADPTWFDELERCPRRAFVDVDPLFTQAAMVKGEGTRGTAPTHYNVLFTYGTRIGMPDCTIPSAGRTWIPTRPVVSTRMWTPQTPSSDEPVTTVAHWAAGSDLPWEGRIYGHKDREFERLIDLPRQTSRRLVLALGGRRAPRERLSEHGWHLVDPLRAAATLEGYQSFIASSYADLAISKDAYVASRSGWFSDRSASYLAAGRPVIHQDTGFTDWLQPGEGVISFSGPADIVSALECLEADYARHSKAARRIAEDEFEASSVIGRMLDDAGFR